jgi:hypothetical protein
MLVHYASLHGEARERWRAMIEAISDSHHRGPQRPTEESPIIATASISTRSCGTARAVTTR